MSLENPERPKQPEQLQLGIMEEEPSENGRFKRFVSRCGHVAVRGSAVMAGGLIGLIAGSQTELDDGPAKISAEIAPSLDMEGGTTVDAGPLGGVFLPTHRGPFQNRVNIESFNGKEIIGYLNDPDAKPDLMAEADKYQGSVDDMIRRSLAGLVIGSSVMALGGAYLESRRHGDKKYSSSVKTWAPYVLAPALSIGAAGAMAYTTSNEEAVEDVQMYGFINEVPQVRDQLEIAIKDFDTYNKQLVNTVYYLGRINQSLSNLRTVSDGEQHFLAAGDIHCMPGSYEAIDAAVENPAYDMRFVLLTGDFVDNGTALENNCFNDIDRIDLPIIAVKGNHDSEQTMEALENKGVIVLDGEVTRINGTKILGVGDPRKTIGENLSLMQRSEVKQAQNIILEAHAKEVYELAEEHQPDIILAAHPASLEYVKDLVPITVAGDTHQATREFHDESFYGNPGSLGGSGARSFSNKTQAVDRKMMIVGAQEDKVSSVTDINHGGIDETRAKICQGGTCTEATYCEVSQIGQALDCKDERSQE